MEKRSHDASRRLVVALSNEATCPHKCSKNPRSNAVPDLQFRLSPAAYSLEMFWEDPRMHNINNSSEF